MRRSVGVSAAVLLAVTAGSAASSGFKPIEGRYAGTYSSTSHRTGPVRITVGGFLRPDRRHLPAVRLGKLAVTLRCPGHRSRTEDVQVGAARIGRTFSGFMIFPGGKISFTGRFTALDALRGTVRVRRSNAAMSCDSGAVTFIAQRVGS
jgi:hypothetical protein